MFPLLISAGFIGLIHSLAPGHWLPIILISKSHRWTLDRSLIGALIASLGHILIATLLGLVVTLVGSALIHSHSELIEKYSGYFMGVFGLVYAGSSFFKHSHCEDHAHHGPEIPKQGKHKKNKTTPYFFLFSTGLNPCLALLPMILAATPTGGVAVIATILAFCSGVILALTGATLLVFLGISKLDHPILEHYGDVITGITVATMGFTLLI